MRLAHAVPVLAAATLTAAAGADQLFRGHDQNVSGTGVLANRPNSDAARAAFLAAVSGPTQVQDFEAMPTGAPPSVWTFSGGFNATFTSTATSGSFIQSGLNSNNAYPAQGDRFLDSQTAPGSTFFSLRFATAINSLGFFLTDASDWIGNSDVPEPLYIELLDSSDSVLARYDLITALAPVNINNGGTAYFGIVADTAFAGFRIGQPLRPSGSNALTDDVGFDEFTIAIPGPGPLALALLGLGGLRRPRR